MHLAPGLMGPDTPLQGSGLALCRRREARLAKRAEQQADPGLSVPRLQPITHRQGSASLAPAIQVPLPCMRAETPAAASESLRSCVCIVGDKASRMAVLHWYPGH